MLRRSIFPLVLITLITFLFGCRSEYPKYPIGNSFWQLENSLTQSRVTNSLLKNSVSLLFFGYTSCPDFCPMTLGKIGKVYRSFSKKNLQVIFVSVDHEKDNANSIRTYSDQFGYPIIGLYGNKSQIDDVVSSFKIDYKITKDKKLRKIDHPASVFLSDSNGIIRYIFKYDADENEYRKVLEDFI